MKNLIRLACIGVLAAGCAKDRYATYDHKTPTTYGGEVVSSPANPSSPFYAPPPEPVGQGAAAATQMGSDADRALASQVREQFNRYANLTTVSPNVQVSAQKGIVTLRGYVPTDQDRQFVANVARNTPGVTGVNDELRVGFEPAQPTGRMPDTTLPAAANTTRSLPGEIFNLHVQGLNPTDRTLAQRILDGLQTDQSLLALFPSVDINVQGGRIVLQGTVQNQQQKQAIAAAVQRAAGSNNVADQLRVQAP